MAQSNRFRRSLHLACIATLGLAFATEGWASVPAGAPRPRADAEARVSMMAEPGACKPGVVEEILNDWLVSTRDSEFESDYAALAFDELVELVYVLRDIAQDFCV